MKEYISEAGYRVIKSFRRSFALHIKNGEVVVKVPFFISKKTVEDFIDKHKNWIEKKNIKKRESLIDLTKLNDYKRNAKIYIPYRTKELADIYWLIYNNIRITSAKTRWGSCSSKKNLNFTYRLILMHKEIIDYIIIHELAHLKEMNHSRAFWDEVEKMMPDYKVHEKWLKENNDLYSIL